MRIGVNGRFYAAPVTGVQRVARELAGRLYPRVETVLLLPHNTATPDTGTAPHAMHRGTMSGQLWEQLELPRMARRAGCDLVVHPANSAPAHGGRHVLFIHDVLALTHPHWFTPAFARWYAFALRRAARAAALIVTVSHWSKAEIVRVLDVPGARVLVIPQGAAPFDTPAAPAHVQRVEAALGLNGSYLLAVGWGDARKNLDFLLQLLRDWPDADRPTLVITGGTAPRVHGGSRAPDVAAGVRWLGRVEDDVLHALYTGAAAVCVPSLAEGFGRPALEALACGTHVIAADYGPAGEVLGDAAQRLPLTTDAWTAALRAAVSAPAHDPDAVRLRRARAAGFSWDSGVAALIDACASLTTEAARARGARP